MITSDSVVIATNGSGLRPDLCLAVGVTGHRLTRLQNVDLQTLRATIAAILSNVHQAAKTVATQHAVHFASTTPKMRLVTALANGADTIAADAALSAGWQLDACLPFVRNEYANDFADGADRENYEQLLIRATSTFALNGERHEADAAYEAVGRVVLDQSDILLAIWDGDVGRGRGGTARVVAEAIGRHIPVIHIDIRLGRATELLWSGLADFEIEQPTIDLVPRADAASVMGAVVAALAMPPDNPVDQRMLARFYRERSRSRTPALPYPLLLAMTGTRKFSRADMRPAAAEDCAAPLAAQLPKVSHDDRYGDALIKKLVARFGVAD